MKDVLSSLHRTRETDMAEAAQHTPGPWEISGISMDDGSISIRHSEYRIIIAYATNAASFGDFVSAAIRGRRDFGAPDTAVTQWANARLIAAAPDLLAAAIWAEAALAPFSHEPSEKSGISMLRAAIAKATP
jgi:hypothetical protein